MNFSFKLVGRGSAKWNKIQELQQQQQKANKAVQNKKMMFNELWSDITMRSQIKPTCWIYVLHNLHRHSSVSQLLILYLNVEQDVRSLKSLAQIFKLLTLKKIIVSVTYLTEYTLFILRVLTFQKLFVKFFKFEKTFHYYWVSR